MRHTPVQTKNDAAQAGQEPTEPAGQAQQEQPAQVLLQRSHPLPAAVAVLHATGTLDARSIGRLAAASRAVGGALTSARVDLQSGDRALKSPLLRARS